MVAANKAAGLDPVEDTSVPEDYTLSVPIFQKNPHPPIVITPAQARRIKGGMWRVYQTTRVFRSDHKSI